MQYVGSKSRFKKYIIPILEKHLNDVVDYVEPFVGGSNLIDDIRYKNKFGYDNNKYLIAMYKELNNGKEYKDFISKDDYDGYKKMFRSGYDGELNDEIGYYGLIASFNARFYDGCYSKTTTEKTGRTRNYISEKHRNIELQRHKLLNINYSYSDYKDIEVKNKSLIYCDPPYEGTIGYATSKDFNHNEFWDWCREMGKLGHIIYVSEYNAPNDFECVWTKKTKTGLKTYSDSNSSERVEKLFRYKGGK